MELKHLPKSLKIYERLKALDAEIITIDKLANSLVSNENILSVSLVVEKPRKEKANIDTDGYEIPMLSMGMMFMTHRMRENLQENSDRDKHTFSLSEVDTFLMLQALIVSKNRVRDSLIAQLEELGVK